MKHAWGPSKWFSSVCMVWLFLNLVGCATVQSFLKLQKPTARIVNIGLAEIDLDSVTLTFDVEVENPYPVPLALVNVDYQLAGRDKPFLSGEATLQGTVPAKGKKTISLPAKVIYTQLLEALKDIRPGSVFPYKADLGLSVDVQIAGRLRLPIHTEGELPVPALPDVEITEIQWEKVTMSEAGGRVNLRIVNRNQFPLELSRFTYTLSLSDVEVASSSLAEPIPFEAAGGVGSVEIPISFAPSKLGLAVFRMLTGKGSSYALRGMLAVETPFGPMALPIEKAGETIFRR